MTASKAALPTHHLHISIPIQREQSEPSPSFTVNFNLPQPLVYRGLQSLILGDAPKLGGKRTVVGSSSGRPFTIDCSCNLSLGNHFYAHLR